MSMENKTAVEIVSEVLGVPVDKDAALNDTPKWDSLAHVQLMVKLHEYGADISPLEMGELTSVRLIDERLGRIEEDSK